ncbi:MAG: glycosyltransferase [Nitrososphaerota archaeon]|nr:glycosyltransferase [Nitrososphaerota archaeon]
MLRRTLSTFIKVVALSGKEVGELVSNLHLDGERVTSLQNFYDEILDSKVEEKGSIGNEAFSLDTPYLCSISRIDRRKNFLSVLKAIKGLSVNFVLAGSDHGGLSELLDFARVNDITNFSYLGVISDEVKRRLISNSLATILPSYCEGFPLFVLESLSRGKVCITTESNYMENLDGIVLTGTDPDSIKASISTVISRNCPIPKVRLKSNEQTFLDLMGIIQSAMKWS